MPKKWGQLEVFTESLPIGNLDLRMVGLSLANQAELQATGSAVDPGAYPWERAYFELFERAALLDAEQRAAGQILEESSLLFNHNGEQINYANIEKAFTPIPQQDNWRYSKSNGVAVHLSLLDAIKNAGWELIERDRVLRYWYSKRAPRRILNWQTMIAKEVYEQYNINAYSFQEFGDLDKDIWVVGIFGFPKITTSEAPFVLGFGAGDSQESALKKAVGEIYQRLAFLWAEEKSEKLPELKPDPSFHLEYYHSPTSWTFLQDWLNGKIDSHYLDFQPVCWKDIIFVNFDIASPTLQLYMVKAISNKNVPLTFGDTNPKISFSLLGQAAIHPIA